MSTAENIHRESIVIDATCPVAVLDRIHQNFMQGGVTAISATVGYGVNYMGSLDYTMKNLGKWFDWFRDESKNLQHITSVTDIYRAKRENKLGVIFHFQGSLAFEDDIKTVELYHRLGLRIGQLCYNTKDRVGCGCAVEKDTGLTEFGEKIIGEMNRLGIVVDCAHTGHRTSMDAIESSKSPVIISHGNARAVHNNGRNLHDDIIKAIANNGGVIGMNGFPSFVADKPRPTLEDLLDHVDYITKLVGVEHICIGIDYFEYQAGVVGDETAHRVYNRLLESGAWAKEDYPPPPWYYPQGIEMPENFQNMTIGLHKRGYSKEDIQGILGLNLIRVFEKVWQ